MTLTQLLDLNHKDVISCVGSGGKTSFIYTLGNELRREKVLVTTTTKMFKPRDKQVDYLVKENEFNIEDLKNGITFLYDDISNENKVHCSEDTINSVVDKFDFTLIESDGSKRKPLKAWKDGEPVIIKKTTKTVGIIPIQTIGMKIDDENIHRIDLFQKIFNIKKHDYITMEHLKDIVLHEEGIFRNSIGEKTLFINGIDGEKELEMARKLLKEIVSENNKFPLKIIGGTLRGSNFFKF